MGSKPRVAIVCSTVVAFSLMLASFVRSEVFAVPSSENVIHATLNLPGGGQVRVRAREGSMITVQREGGYMVGFVPHVQSRSESLAQGNLKVNLLPFRITELEENVHRVDEEIGESLAVAFGQIGTIHIGGLTFKLKVSGITTENFISPSLPDPSGVPVKELQDTFGMLSGDTCCVTCGQVTVCANGGVTMSCGSCSGGGGGRIPI